MTYSQLKIYYVVKQTLHVSNMHLTRFQDVSYAINQKGNCFMIDASILNSYKKSTVKENSFAQHTMTTTLGYCNRGTHNASFS